MTDFDYFRLSQLLITSMVKRNQWEQHVTVQAVIERFGASLERAKALLLALLKHPLPEVSEEYRRSLDMALLTPDSAMTDGQRAMLDVLRR